MVKKNTLTEFRDYLPKNIFFDKYSKEIEEKLPAIIEYISFVDEWNKTHNITSRTLVDNDIFDAVLDSVIGGHFLSFSKSIYDAGSGGGFPGFVLAIMFPEIEFTLVESNRKKCSFLLSSKARMNLKNIKVANLRIESFNELPFIITKAAFSPINVGILAKVLAKQGILAIWTTPKDTKGFEEALYKEGLKLKAIHNYALPSSKERVILELIKPN